MPLDDLEEHACSGFHCNPNQSKLEQKKKTPVPEQPRQEKSGEDTLVSGGGRSEVKENPRASEDL